VTRDPEGARADPGADDAGASEPSPSLAARIDRSAVEGRELEELGTVPASATTPVTDRQNTGSESRLAEGDETAPRDGRVDAAGATFGPDPERQRIGATAAGGTPTESVGAALGTPADADDLESAERGEASPTSGTSPG
jgi:hypothetical protein